MPHKDPTVGRAYDRWYRQTYPERKRTSDQLARQRAQVLQRDHADRLTTLDAIIDLADFLAHSPFVRAPFIGKTGEVVAAIACGLEWGIKIPQELRCVLALPRFWAHVVQADPMACWRWTGTMNRAGYGVLPLWPGYLLAHRYAWRITFGWQALGDQPVCHRCDVRSCVNPGHLYAGTPADNTRDMVSRGRARHGPPMPGESHPNAKLTDAQVREIRRLYDTGEANQPEIARRYGISQTWASGLVRRKFWTHVKEQDHE